ncbi:60S acidic ribosomal protein P0-3 [Camellia lanceoleosa]|uniref:60S acidic ribosomal protein P0-3 n=1 Tax=Camellia lanceoleosa TaxID=1840588 RepID=A0ACC0GWC4_9ERIC|nr:60S acidic ribosomal protein P0-3 [Camellia lanceoleosa]
MLRSATMVVKASKVERKSSYNTKLCSLPDIYSQILIVAADNVRSNQRYRRLRTTKAKRSAMAKRWLSRSHDGSTESV